MGGRRLRDTSLYHAELADKTEEAFRKTDGEISGDIWIACGETEGIVSIANYNCPGQIVITGEEQAVAKAGEACKEAGAKRVVPLKVSGPFHSAMLKGAGEKLAEELSHVTVHKPEIPYVANVTADYVTEAEAVKPLLKEQVSASVRWQQTIERLIADGVDEFVEIGPGKTLSGFMKKINRDVKVCNIDKLEDFEAFVGTHPLQEGESLC